MTRIGIIHKQVLFSNLMSEYLKSQLRYDVVEIYNSTNQIDSLAKIAQLDIMIVDVGVVTQNDLLSIQNLLSYKDNPTILALCELSTKEQIHTLKKIGIVGVLDINDSPIDLIKALDAITLNGRYYREDKKITLNNNINKVNHSLTKREMEILELFINGKTLSSIAKLLNISMNTVKSHKSSINAKLNVHSTQELLLKAKELQLI